MCSSRESLIADQSVTLRGSTNDQRLGGQVELKGWSFAHRASLLGSMTDTMTVFTYSDFALMDMDMLGISRTTHTNGYSLNSTDPVIYVTKTATTLEAGTVHILTGEAMLLSGYLLEEASTIMDKDGIMATRKIELDAALCKCIIS
jgi:hypothetical protein